MVDGSSRDTDKEVKDGRADSDGSEGIEGGEAPIDVAVASDGAVAPRVSVKDANVASGC